MQTIVQTGSLLKITLAGPRLDAAAAPSLRAAVAEGIVGKPRLTIVDASNVEFVDFTGLGALVGVLKMMDGAGVLAIAGANPGLRRLLQITGLERVFKLFDTVTDAEEALQPEGE